VITLSSPARLLLDRFLLEHRQHAVRDDEAAEDVDGGKHHGDAAEELRGAQALERRRQQRADDDQRTRRW
jgi:hypothetical protein